MDGWKDVFMAQNNPSREFPLTWPYLALVLCPTCEEEGEVKETSFGDPAPTHETAAVHRKPIPEAPGPPPGCV